MHPGDAEWSNKCVKMYSQQPVLSRITPIRLGRLLNTNLRSLVNGIRD